MSDRLWQRLGAACGIVYVVLLMVAGNIGGPTSTVAIFLVFLAFTFFLFFLGSLWDTLRRAEGGSGWLSATAFGGGLVAIAVKLVGDAPLLAARYRAGDGLDPQLARALQDMYDAAFLLHFFPLAVLLAAFAIVALRSVGLPQWLGWVAVIIAVAFIAGAAEGSANLESEWAGLPFLLFLVWVLAASIVLIRRAGAPRPAEKETPVGQAAPMA